MVLAVGNAGACRTARGRLFADDRASPCLSRRSASVGPTRSCSDDAAIGSIVAPPRWSRCWCSESDRPAPLRLSQPVVAGGASHPSLAAHPERARRGQSPERSCLPTANTMECTSSESNAGARAASVGDPKLSTLDAVRVTTLLVTTLLTNGQHHATMCWLTGGQQRGAP